MILFSVQCFTEPNENPKKRKGFKGLTVRRNTQSKNET